MPFNPYRAWQGGDVEGTTKTDVEGAVGDPVTVADASYEAGYDCQEATMEAGYVTLADLKQGFSSYGVGIGDGRPKQMIGGSKR
jgi:hypothetical protein